MSLPIAGTGCYAPALHGSEHDQVGRNYPPWRLTYAIQKNDCHTGHCPRAERCGIDRPHPGDRTARGGGSAGHHRAGCNGSRGGACHGSGATAAPLRRSTAAPAAAPAPEDRVTAIKTNLATSAQNIKQYQWMETQVFNLKGEDKSQTASTCSYGADGKIVKTPTAPKAEEEKKRGIKGKVVENKKEDISKYMQSVAALIKTYIPPDAAKIGAAKEAGKISMTPLDGGKRARLDIKDYAKPGDNLGIEIDMANNQVLGLSVASYLTEAKDAVTLDVKMASLPDGTGYPASILLNGVSQEIKVTITNTGYQKKAQ